MNSSRSSIITEFGDKRLSPIMEITTCLVKRVCDYTEKTKENSLYFFCFPDRNYSSVWLSVGLLANFFLEDYIENDNDPGIHPVPKSNYEIYGNIGKFLQFDDSGRLVFEFAGGAKVNVHPKLKKFLRNTNKCRLSQLRDYKENRKHVINNRSAVSQLLEPNEGIRVNDQTLTSKIILISGRGNANKFREYIQNTNICGESLKQIFTLKGNLQIRENLSSFNGIFDENYNNKARTFIEAFNCLLDVELGSALLEQLTDLSSALEVNGINEAFDIRFCELVNDLGDEMPDLAYLKERFYPGPKLTLPKNLRAVIINDILQFELYTDTINNFINNGIPVFVISDRLVDFHNNPAFFTEFFDRYDYCRINWNKSKILRLMQTENTETRYIDEEFWTTCKRFARQKIKIEVFNGCSLDLIIYDLRKEIKKYSDYQRLREAYYNFLETAFSLVKNSRSRSEHCTYLIKCFNEVLNDLRDIINRDLLEKLDKALVQIISFETNTKEIPEGQNYFSVTMTAKGVNIIIPDFASDNNFTDEETEQIVFTGYPYNEPLRYFLHDSVCRFFIPEIIIKTWPLESELTLHYIRRRLRSGYFTDKNCAELGVPTNCLVTCLEDIESEIDESVELRDRRTNAETYEYSESVPEDNPDQEGDLNLLARARFNQRPRDENAPLVNPVNCHTVVFEDDSYMYMPVASVEGVKAKIMVGRFDKTTGKFIVERIDGGHLEIDQYFFDIDYYVNLPAVLQLSGINQSDAETITLRLYLWRNLLFEIFERNDGCLESLIVLLQRTKENYPEALKKSNPAIYNLRNWLYNKDILAPDPANIKLIFMAAGYDGTATPEDIIKIRKEIIGSLISLSSAVKNDIERKFTGKKTIVDSYFEYEKNNVKIKCNIKRISSIVRDNIMVEYSATRKIMAI